MSLLREPLRRIASHPTSVFIAGEPGTGKEVLARYLHDQSPRAAAPFVTVAVAGLATENPGAELFGSEDRGTVHFECHFLDVKTQKVAAVTAGTADLARINNRWLITNFVGSTAELKI